MLSITHCNPLSSSYEVSYMLHRLFIKSRFITALGRLHLHPNTHPQPSPIPLSTFTFHFRFRCALYPQGLFITALAYAICYTLDKYDIDWMMA